MMNYKKKRGLIYLMMAMPFVIFVFLFSYIPLFGWGYAFVDYRTGFSILESEFVGLKHFRAIFTDRNMGRVFCNTLAMSCLGLLSSPLPVFFAILLNEVRNSKVKKVTQTVTTLPNFISWIIIYGIAYEIFSGNGLLNQIVELLGLPQSQFGIMGNEDATWGFMWSLGTWKGLGWSAIVYLAAITGIDAELYDAAKVDGANKVQCIRYITLPGVLPTYMVLLLLSIGSILNSGFEQYYMFWNPLNADKIEVLDYYIYKLGFTSGRYSYAIAVGVVKNLIGIAMLSIANISSKKLRGESIF